MRLTLLRVGYRRLGRHTEKPETMRPTASTRLRFRHQGPTLSTEARVKPEGCRLLPYSPFRASSLILLAQRLFLGRHQMAIWEYQITTFSGKPENLSAWLNEQGKQGWELVYVERPTYWFKRQEGMMEANYGKIAS